MAATPAAAAATLILWAWMLRRAVLVLVCSKTANNFWHRLATVVFTFLLVFDFFFLCVSWVELLFAFVFLVLFIRWFASCLSNGCMGAGARSTREAIIIPFDFHVLVLHVVRLDARIYAYCMCVHRKTCLAMFGFHDSNRRFVLAACDGLRLTLERIRTSYTHTQTQTHNL